MGEYSRALKLARKTGGNTVYLRIFAALERATGVRLTADEVIELSMDGAIEERAELDRIELVARVFSEVSHD